MFIKPDGGLEMRSSLTSEQMYSNVPFETLKKCLNASSSSDGIDTPTHCFGLLEHGPTKHKNSFCGIILNKLCTCK